MKHFIRLMLLFALVLTTLVVPGTSATADTSAVVNFQGFNHGDFTTSLTCAMGVTCAGNVPGQISVWGHNPWTEPFASGANAAQVFDPNVSSPEDTPDWDLLNPFDGGLPDLGNIMFVSDMQYGLPSDEFQGAVSLSFDFTGFGPGYVMLNNLTIIDIDNEERSGTIEVYSLNGGGSSVTIFPMPVTGNHRYAVLGINIAEVTRLVVNFPSSGALTDIQISVPDNGGFQGCTPGYWRQPQHLDSWVNYSPEGLFEEVFLVSLPRRVDGYTLLEAAWARGGQERALLRHATAALLNANNPAVYYAYSEADVFAMVRSAFATGDYETWKNVFADANEAGCPLN